MSNREQSPNELFLAHAAGTLSLEERYGRPARDGYRLVVSLMSNTVIEIEEDTPFCCDPSSETYWCM